MILRPLSTNVHSPDSSHCTLALGKIQKWLGARVTLEIELK